MSEFLRHERCPKCGSTNNLAVYTDGSFCFTPGCGYYSGSGISHRPSYPLPTIQATGMPKRGIPKATVEKYQSGIEYVDNKPARFHFPNVKDGMVLGSKYRIIDDGTYKWEDKQFRWLGESSGLYGMDTATKTSIVIHEGECYTPDVEVLTRKGWVKFDDYEGQEIAQYIHENKSNESHTQAAQNCDGHIEWVTPDRIIAKPYTGDIIKFRSSRTYSMSVTPGHNMVYRSTGGVAVKHMAGEGLPSKQSTVIRSAVYRKDNVYDGTTGQQASDSNIWNTRQTELRIIVSVSADAGITYNQDGRINCDFNLKKQRKIDRLRELVDSLKLDASFCVHTNKPDYTRVRMTLPKRLSIGRLFPMQWISGLSYAERECIIQELQHWDGWANEKHIEYATKYKHNADFIQSVATLNGYVATISPFFGPETSKGRQTYYKVYIYYDASATTVGSISTSNEHYSGLVYCVTVPSGMLLVRHNDSISVCGNCDAMAGDVMSGVTHSNVSVTHGAKGAVDDVKQNMDWLENFETIYISFDNDDPGRLASSQVAALFPPGKCRVITHHPHYKDANDYLMAGDVEAYLTALGHAEAVKPAGLVSPAELKEITRQYLFDRDKWRGIPTGIKGFDRICGGLRPGSLITVYGGTGLGKTAFVRQIAFNIIQTGHPVLFIPLEMTPQQIAVQMLEMFFKRRIQQYDIGSLTLSEQEYEEKFMSALGNLHTYQHFGAMQLQTLTSAIHHAAEVDKCRLVVLDHKDAAVNSGKEDDSNYRGIDNLMGKLKESALEHNITVMVVSHISRGLHDKDDTIPDLNRIRGSQGVAQNSDVVFGCSRKRDSNILEVITKKGDRFTGESGSFRLEYNKTTLCYKELEDGNSTQGNGSEEAEIEFTYQEGDYTSEPVRKDYTGKEPVLTVRATVLSGEDSKEVHTRLEDGQQVGEGDLCGEQGILQAGRQETTQADEGAVPGCGLEGVALQCREAYIERQENHNDLW